MCGSGDMITFANSVKISKFALFWVKYIIYSRWRQATWQKQTAMKLGALSTRILMYIPCELQLHISTRSPIMGLYVHPYFSENVKSENNTSVDLPP